MNGKFSGERIMKYRFVCFLAIACGLTFAQTSAIEKPSDRVIRYAHEAASDPLTPASAEARAAAMQIVQDDHQTHVLLCQNVFNQMRSNNSKNAHEVTFQYLISAAAYLYQHPESSGDMSAQNVAGLDAAAKVYQKFVEAEPKSHFKFMDNVLKQQSGGTLKDFVANTCK